MILAQLFHEGITEFFELLNTCWILDFHKFRNKFYKFPDEVGVPMGSPVGFLISNISMYKFENYIFSSHHCLLDYVNNWHRYIDDILWNGFKQLVMKCGMALNNW